MRAWESLPRNRLEVLPAKDGYDCFFHSLARHMGSYCTPDGRCDESCDLRKMVADGLLTHVSAEVEMEAIHVDQISVEAYVDGIRTNKWAGTTELKAAGRILDVDVRYVSLDQDNNWRKGEETNFGLQRVDTEQEPVAEPRTQYVFVHCNMHWMPAKLKGS